MAGTVTITEVVHGSIKKVKYAWTSDASGNADGTTSLFYTGRIEGLTTVPGTGGDVPTNGYSITVTEGDSIDVLHGSGSSKSSTVTESVSAYLGVDLGFVVADKLKINVSGAGNAKKGTAYVFVR